MKEELFNLRHSQLWNVVERVYGVFKIYFRIFQSARDGLTMATQVKLIYALLAVHNWINSHRGSPWKEWQSFMSSQKARDRELYDQIMEDLAAAMENSPPIIIADTWIMDKWRESIAEEMWESYQVYLAQREDNALLESSESE